VLAYGMETFFLVLIRNPIKKVERQRWFQSFGPLFYFSPRSFLFRDNLEWSLIDSQYITYTIWILALDALVIIPFSKLRVNQKPMVYAAIKIEVCWLTWFWALFFTLYPMFIEANPHGFLSSVYVDNFQIGYIFLANIIASLLSFLVLFPNVYLSWKIDINLWKRMMRYGTHHGGRYCLCYQWTIRQNSFVKVAAW
jgi:hypothetical protein